MSNDAARGGVETGSGLTSGSPESDPRTSGLNEAPTRVRYGVAGVLIVMACLLYLDRFAVGIASEYIREDLRMTQTQMSWFISAFFWSYALSQVPAGWLSDRFGRRLMLTIYILAWSTFTGLLGLAASVWLVLHLRLYMGAAQAGAFPVCGGLIRNWFPISQRGTASSIIALGGRAGGVLAPILTAWCIVAFARSAGAPDFSENDVIDPTKLVNHLRYAEVSDDPKDEFLKVQFAKLPDSLKRHLEDMSFRYTMEPAPRAPSPFSFIEDWIPVSSAAHGAPTDEEAMTASKLILAQLNNLLDDIELVTDQNVAPLRLPPNGKSLLEKRTSGVSLTFSETKLLNRLAIEAALSKEIKKLNGRGWRPTLILYGIVGLAVALVLAWVGRDTPKQHSWCNEAERRFIDDEASLAAKAVEPRDAPFPCRAIVTSLSLWGNSLMQFFTNIGWLFAVTWLPRYLDKVHGVPLAEQALMTAVPTAAGIVGMLFGGRWTDLTARKLGLKWGRRLPIASTRLLSAFGYGICLTLGILCTPDPTTRWLPWAMIAGLSVMVMGVDLGVPATWAYAQDVGGKYTGAILGWANMWGNIGAAVAPLIYNAVLGETPSLTQWNTMFAVCAVAFVLSGLCGLVLDATKPITQEAL
ncbi:MAG: MFS transporter [Planctomycetales bacterium]|nr:MFS transporter [Planctomycetales bacterium]